MSIRRPPGAGRGGSVTPSTPAVTGSVAPCSDRWLEVQHRPTRGSVATSIVPVPRKDPAVLTVLVCTTAVVAAVCAAIRMEAVWLSAAPRTPASTGAAPAAHQDEVAVGGRPG
jgi:hypothetical protein